MDRLQLNQKVIAATLHRIEKALPYWHALLANSFLSRELKQRYGELLIQRSERLGLQGNK